MCVEYKTIDFYTCRVYVHFCFVGLCLFAYMHISEAICLCICKRMHTRVCVYIYPPLLCSVPGWPFALLRGRRGGGVGLLQGSSMLVPVPHPSYSHVVCPALDTCRPSSRSNYGPFLHVASKSKRHNFTLQKLNVCKILNLTNLLSNLALEVITKAKLGSVFINHEEINICFCLEVC